MCLLNFAICIVLLNSLCVVNYDTNIYFFFKLSVFLLKRMCYFCVRRKINMIQRVQTIYLLLATAFSGGLIFVFDLWKSVKKNIFVMDLLSSDFLQLKAIPILFLLTALISLVAIFLYKNRQLQFVIVRISILINLILLGLLIYVSLSLPGETQVSEKGISMFIPILAILLLVLANKAIKKDEDLVKSVDRLR